jgi:hypothetical protein
MGSKKKCWPEKKRNMYWMMKAFRVMAVKNYVEPESYDKIVSSNV